MSITAQTVVPGFLWAFSRYVAQFPRSYSTTPASSGLCPCLDPPLHLAVASALSILSSGRPASNAPLCHTHGTCGHLPLGFAPTHSLSPWSDAQPPPCLTPVVDFLSDIHIRSSNVIVLISCSVTYFSSTAWMVEQSAIHFRTKSCRHTASSV